MSYLAVMILPETVAASFFDVIFTPYNPKVVSLLRNNANATHCVKQRNFTWFPGVKTL